MTITCSDLLLDLWVFKDTLSKGQGQPFSLNDNSESEFLVQTTSRRKFDGYNFEEGCVIGKNYTEITKRSRECQYIYTTLYSKSKLPLKSHPSLGEHATKL